MLYALLLIVGILTAHVMIRKNSIAYAPRRIVSRVCVWSVAPSPPLERRHDRAVRLTASLACFSDSMVGTFGAAAVSVSCPAINHGF